MKNSLKSIAYTLFSLLLDKSGCPPSDCVTIVDHILAQCKKLNFVGLMTIGQLGRSNADSNPDFKV